MAVGINTENMNAFKVNILDFIEEMNRVSTSLNDSFDVITNNYHGIGKEQIVARMQSIKDSFPTIIANFNTCMSDIDKVVGSYEEQDIDMSKQVLSNISIVDEGR